MGEGLLEDGKAKEENGADGMYAEEEVRNETKH